MTTGAEITAVDDVRVRRGALRTLLRNPLAVGAACVLAALAVVAVIGPWIAPYSAGHVNIYLTNAPPFSSEFLLGGDRYGRDILSALLFGIQNAMLAALIFALVAVGVGTVSGLIAGYFGGWADTVGNAVFAVLLTVPGVILLIALYTLIEVSLPLAMAVFGLLSSTGVFFLTRALTRNVRRELYVDAARVSGLSNARIVGRHVLLAVRGPIIILTAFLAGAGLSLSAGLDFIGLGDRSRPSWGSILNDAFSNYYVAPWQIIWPGLALGISTAAFVLLGNAFRDAFEGVYVKPSAARARREVDALLARTDVADGSTTTRSADPTSALLVVDDLHVAYPAEGELKTVVDGVGLEVAPGEVVGLVGESGSGKTQTVFAVLGLLAEQAVVARGAVWFAGVDLLRASPAELRGVRGAHIAYVPQEPMSNLDPSFTVGSQIVEAIRAQSVASRAEARRRALDMLARVGIRDPERTYRSYPHEISGGMAQRVLIASAVASRPRLLIADEPTTALDVTVQAEVLDLLRDLREEIGMSILLVTHNLGVVADLCDRVVVMRSGRIVEAGEVRDVLLHPGHEYTRMLVDSLLDDKAPRSRVSDEVGGADE